MILTDPTTLPHDIKQKLLNIRDALVIKDTDEAWHQLYSIADPNFNNILNGHRDPFGTIESKEELEFRMNKVAQREAELQLRASQGN